MNKEDIEEFYSRVGLEHLKLQREVSKEYNKNKINIFFKSLNFTTTITSTVGIIAGFGFSALNHVQSKLLFFFGEAFLIYSIIHGLTWLQSIYNNEFQSLDEAQKKHREHFKKRNAKFSEIYDKMQKNILNKEEIAELREMDIQTIELFRPKNTDSQVKEIYSKKLYYLMIVGTLLLFFSFFDLFTVAHSGLHFIDQLRK